MIELITTFLVPQYLLFTIIVMFLIYWVTSLFQRIIITISYISCLAIGFIGDIELLSNPRPSNIFWFNDVKGEAILRDSYMIQSGENSGIYLFLDIKNDDKPYPVYYVLDFDLDLAQKIQDAERKSENDGTDVIIDLGKLFAPSLEDRDSPVYNMPPLKIPFKNENDDGRGIEYEAPKMNI